MAIEIRNLEPVTKLIAKYKKEEYRAEVIAGEEGKVKYRLADGREFKSPSAAGTAITSKACNGWAFWSVDLGDTPGEPEIQDSQVEDSPEPEVVEQPSSAAFRRVPNQRGVGEGEIRLYCGACQKSFTAPADQQPESCPEGHGPDAGQQGVVED